MAARAYYADRIEDFLNRSPDEIVGALTRSSRFSIDQTQRDAWLEQISVLRRALSAYRGRGKVYFEYSVPRLGKRIDVVLVIDHVLFVIEFKVGEANFTSYGVDQVCDYGLDLKNFHETSHHVPLAPVLIATRAPAVPIVVQDYPQQDGLLVPIQSAREQLQEVIERVLASRAGPVLDAEHWEQGRYLPTPTIVEAAMALYAGHKVTDISRRDAGAMNLTQTSEAVTQIARSTRAQSRKAICFVTGVPGAGKTLVGLNIATEHIDKENDLYSVFLSGNGPLVDILREALARDKVRREREAGHQVTLGGARREVELFVQNVHHFRDECLVDKTRPPLEHIALFDEAQRAWNQAQTAKFMRQKRGVPDFEFSEPEFLISCMNRHQDWAVVVCLVGGGQEINTGEAGISEWIDALLKKFPEWHIHISSQLHDSEYGAGSVLQQLRGRPNVFYNDALHLGVSMRSFRAEHVSTLVKHLLDRDADEARIALRRLNGRYPIFVTRSLHRAKTWLRETARGNERYGIVVSSEAQRLRPLAIDVRSPMDPIHWFLDGKDDVRSSFFLEDVATEFHIQGLELDWACVVWDADFRFAEQDWRYFSFVGDGWNHIHKPERRHHLKNAYRVLLTRARQGMVIVVPEGEGRDHTRQADFYDPIFHYLTDVGIRILH
jgi:hypothetical protein